MKKPEAKALTSPNGLQSKSLHGRTRWTGQGGQGNPARPVGQVGPGPLCRGFATAPFSGNVMSCGRWLRHRQRDSDDVTKNKHANVCMAKFPRKKTEKLTYLKDNL